MASEGRKKIPADKILENVERRKIFETVRIKPYSITQLETELKMNRGTLKHHLKLLVRHDILRKEKKDHLAGKPVIFYPTINPQAEDRLFNILKIIEETPNIKMSKLVEDELDVKFGAALSFAEFTKLIEKKLILTTEGKKYIREHS